jgi:hypothetical protein
LVARKLEQYAGPSKIIVYSGSVEQTITIRNALGCSIYHRSVDDGAGKARRLRELTEGKH